MLPQLRIADVIQHVDQDLYGAYAVVADRAAPGHWPVGAAATNAGTAGLAPPTLAQLPDAGRFTAVRNLLYAIEWWFFAAFAAVHLVALDARRAATGRTRPVTRPRPRRGHGAGGRARRQRCGRPVVSGGVKKLFNAYRVLAIVVGVLLAFCSLVGLPAEVPRRARAAPSSSSASTPASCGSCTAGSFMVYVVVAFFLSRKAGWSIGFTVVALVAGLVPLLIFWVEHRVTQRMRAEHPELATAGSR